ncbi:hypothetical protein [Streptomyces sp. NPDC051704]|uniref:hypothetical protein n=1 Tax=Streptomyces sp. NPDC051704 TaxID=3365671 RepID=UPI0037B5BA38
MSVDHAKGTAELNGPCGALQRLALPCTPDRPAPVESRNADVRGKELYSWDTPGRGLFARQTETPKGSVMVLVGRPGQQTSFFALFLPLSAASLIGLAAHYWLATPMTAGSYSDGATHSWPVLTLVLATMFAMALTVWLWGAYGAARLTQRCRPTAD